MKARISILLMLALAVTGCYTPKEDVTVSDLDLVVVDYDGEYDGDMANDIEMAFEHDSRKLKRDLLDALNKVRSE